MRAPGLEFGLASGSGQGLPWRLGFAALFLPASAPSHYSQANYRTAHHAIPASGQSSRGASGVPCQGPLGRGGAVRDPRSTARMARCCQSDLV